MAFTNTSPNDAFDVDLAEKIAAYLVGLRVPQLQRLSVETRGGTVTLRGTVRSHFEKQLAKLCQDRIPGIRQLIDEIEVEGGQKLVPAPPPSRGLEDDSRDSRRFRT